MDREVRHAWCAPPTRRLWIRAPSALVAAQRRRACGSKRGMNETLQPNPVVTFYGAVPGIRAPIRADASGLGTLPSRGFQYCEALRTASSFGWYVFPPIDFTLQWDGSQIIWTYNGAKAWYPLTSAQFPGFQALFDRVAPKRLRGFSPPFLTAIPEPGIIQLWTGLFVESA